MFRRWHRIAPPHRGWKNPLANLGRARYTRPAPSPEKPDPMPRRLLAYPFLCLLPALAAGTPLKSPSQAAVNAAIAAPLIDYGRSFAGGAYTNGAWNGGASVVLAVASHAGNTTADARLLQQLRFSIDGGNAICANGGYPAQHERHVTGMFAIAKHTPRIWNQLSAAEKTKIDLLMKAGLVASAFTTSDNNPFVLAGTQQYTLDGDPNLHRAWNPNYREGMIGGVLVGMVYFGGPAATEALLASYKHGEFVSQLQAQGLGNTHEVFNWRAANPTSKAPTGAQIENAVKSYRLFGMPLSNPMGIYNHLLNDTYGKNVNPGLNDGAGILYNGGNWGRIANGAAGLPNRGAAGMLKEFDSSDAGGARSALSYAYDGYRPHQTNQLVLIVGGYWPKGTPAADAAYAKQKTGNTDLWYKIKNGYWDWSKGKPMGGYDEAKLTKDYGFTYVRSLWEDVLKPYHETAIVLPPDASLDSDGDGTPDWVELRLGLDPHDPSSRFTASIAAGSALGALAWHSAPGESFEVQRSSGNAGFDWQTIAVLSGTDGLQRFTDPDPPLDRAFYRIGLRQ